MQRHLCVLSDVANRRVGLTFASDRRMGFLRRQQSQRFESRGYQTTQNLEHRSDWWLWVAGYQLAFSVYQERTKGFPGGASGAKAGAIREEFDPWVEKIPWRREWQPTLVFLPGKSHGQRAWQATVHGVAESDTSEQLSMHTHLFMSHSMDIWVL